MQVDYLSDLHIDFYFDKNNRLLDEDIYRLYHPIITKNDREIGDILVVAGDLGHYNWQNIRVLKYLKDKYYKNIICVLGNHDYYVLPDERCQFENSFQRVQNMRELINSEKNMYCLNGDVINIEGINFGGCDSWYDRGFVDMYYKEDNISKETLTQIWKKNLNDYNYISYNSGIEHFDDIFQIEKPKIESIYKMCDAMITHVNPSPSKENFSYQFRDSFNNVFFSFDGYEYLRDGTIKHWIFGHSHDSNEFIEFDVTCHCNAFGYPGESNLGYWTVMKSFEI